MHFKSSIEYYDVESYGTIYGTHPTEFVITRHGTFKQTRPGVDAYTAKSPKVMERRRRTERLQVASGPNKRDILRHVLLEGAAWEQSKEEIMAHLCALKKKGRVGAKAVKQAERLESKSFELDPEEATNYRALAARANYLSLDRIELALAAKELCRDFATPTRK